MVCIRLLRHLGLANVTLLHRLACIRLLHHLGLAAISLLLLLPVNIRLRLLLRIFVVVRGGNTLIMVLERSGPSTGKEVVPSLLAAVVGG